VTFCLRDDWPLMDGHGAFAGDVHDCAVVERNRARPPGLRPCTAPG
jgi:hypothetical protein